MQQNWKQCLNDAYNTHAKACGKPRRRIKLPSGISFVGDGKEVQLSLSANCVTANMQSNEAAFEGWSLALRRWCEVEVVLQWTPPPADATKPQLQHYQRFLYRGARFQSLFDWFHIEPDCAARVPAALALSGGSLYLNVGDDRDSVQKSSAEDKAERVLELWLLNKPEFAAHYGFANGTRDRHLPVGLFSGPTPTRASQIFPGGQASIDLIGLSADTLWLFELKAGKNIPAGTITELFFYTSVIRDALCGGPFNFAQPRPEALIQPEALKRVARIEGVMLGHDIHPLLDSGLISILNDAVDARWNAEPCRAHVHFRAERVSQKAQAEDRLDIATVD